MFQQIKGLMVCGSQECSTGGVECSGTYSGSGTAAMTSSRGAGGAAVGGGASEPEAPPVGTRYFYGRPWRRSILFDTGDEVSVVSSSFFLAPKIYLPFPVLCGKRLFRRVAVVHPSPEVSPCSKCHCLGSSMGNAGTSSKGEVSIDVMVGSFAGACVSFGTDGVVP
jgi:hypothetical protein